MPEYQHILDAMTGEVSGTVTSGCQSGPSTTACRGLGGL